LLTGTAEDRPLERWWSLGAARRDILSQLATWGRVAASTPNFSVFSDVPRWDNFHAMMRIGICWQEMTDAGIPTALHVNARSHRDWERWTAFVRERPEVTAIAYEFATGAAGSSRMAYHVEQLRHLADHVNRPLTLVVRGGFNALSGLRKSFAHITMVDSTTHMKTVNRKIAIARANGRIQWKDAPGRPKVDVARLLEHNHLSMLAAVTEQLG
jgi:hypothetical protein